jgi:hypothetical protein
MSKLACGLFVIVLFLSILTGYVLLHPQKASAVECTAAGVSCSGPDLLSLECELGCTNCAYWINDKTCIHMTWRCPIDGLVQHSKVCSESLITPPTVL